MYLGKQIFFQLLTKYKWDLEKKLCCVLCSAGVQEEFQRRSICHV